MPDNTGIRFPEDASRINLSQDYEVAYWCKKFNCTKKELIEAVNEVGDSAKKVEDYLKNKK